MARLLLFLVLIILAALIYRRVLQYKKQNTTSNKRLISKNMVRCDYCGIHVPEDEVVNDDDRSYCSEEHKLLDQPKQ